MALQLNAVQRLNPQTKEKKWYASPKLTGNRDLKGISRDLAEVSSLSAGDVQNVIVNFIDQIPKWLMQGISVKLDGLGSFRLSFSSEGVAEEKDVSVSLVKEIRIIFVADPEIKGRIQNTKINPV